MNDYDISQYSTIDNLPVETSNRRAQDMESKGPNLQDAPRIAGSSQIDVTTPAFATQSSILTGTLKRNKSFSDFNPPTGYNTGTKNFSHLIIPSIGDSDRLSSLSDKLQSLPNLNDTESTEVGKLTNFFSLMGNLNNILQDVHGSIRQFTRG